MCIEMCSLFWSSKKKCCIVLNEVSGYEKLFLQMFEFYFFTTSSRWLIHWGKNKSWAKGKKEPLVRQNLWREPYNLSEILA